MKFSDYVKIMPGMIFKTVAQNIRQTESTVPKKVLSQRYPQSPTCVQVIIIVCGFYRKPFTMCGLQCDIQNSKTNYKCKTDRNL